MDFKIRPYHPSDLPALYRICIQTAGFGEDSSHLYQDHELLGHHYTGPYAVLEPDLCFLLTADGKPAGYVLGARDGQIFHARTEAEWYPVLRERYPLPPDDETTPDADMIRALHRGHAWNPELIDYPAELHIDLLPQGIGLGWGRRLMETFLDRLREVGAPGVHLGVGAGNTRAIGFYRRLGFDTLKEFEWGLLMGQKLAR